MLSKQQMLCNSLKAHLNSHLETPLWQIYNLAFSLVLNIYCKNNITHNSEGLENHYVFCHPNEGLSGL